MRQHRHLNREAVAMNRYPTEPSGDTFKQSVRLHYLSLKHTIFYFLMIAVVKNMGNYFESLISNRFVTVFILLIAFAVMAYFFAASLIATNEAFLDKPKSIKAILTATWERILKIYSSIILYFAGIILTYYVVRLILIVIGKIVREPSALHGGLFIIGVALVFVFVAMFYFAMPLCTIKNTELKTAFYNSLLLTEKVKFNVLVSFVILGALFLLISPAMLHESFLAAYHLTVFFDFVALCVLGPVYVNMILLSINDAELELKLEEV